MHQLNGISDTVDKRSSGYKRRVEDLQSAPDQIPNMIKRAMDSGIEASYVLIDTWFTYQPLIKTIKEQGLDVIGMVKQLKQRYLVGNKRVSLNELYHLAQPISSEKRELLRSILATQANGVQVKVVFVHNRNKKSEWLAILSTDITLTDQEIIKIYGMRWDIEVFFKATKSLLKLQKEFQGRSYDSMISHITIVFSRYIVLSWQNRCHNDQRTLGVFYDLCDEISQLDWAVALQHLIELLQDVLKNSKSAVQKLIKSQLQQWFTGLPNYIKAYLPISVCES
jgi:hypothetical protein